MRPKTGARCTESGGYYYAPYVPQFIDLSEVWTFRKDTEGGTMVRNHEDDEWVFYWDVM